MPNSTAALILGIFCILVFSCDRQLTLSEEWTHLSSVQEEIPSPGPSTQQTACLIFDVNRDGTNDFIVGSRKQGPSLLWYRRISTGWEKYVIDRAKLPIEAGGAFYDLDNDGDLDIVFGGDSSSNSVWWWENPYPDLRSSQGWTRRLIKNSGFNMHHDQIFGDFDGDGAAELVTWNQGTKKAGTNTLFIMDIPSSPMATEPWTYRAIFASPYKCEGLASIDIDGDGKQDIVGGGGWFEHAGKLRYRRHPIDEQQRAARVAVGQLKQGGRPEVVFVMGDGIGRLKWYEWTNASWVGHDLLGFDVDHGHSLQVADIDGDGNLDIFCGEMRHHGGNDDAKMWTFLGDGQGKFLKKEISKGFGVHEAKLGDLDGDGDVDILGKPYDWQTPRLDIWLNKGTKTNQSRLDRWQRHIVDPNKPWRTIFITSADIDRDGRKDIVTGGWWYRNPDTPNGTWQRNAFGSPLNNMAAVYDFDSDGDMDILGTRGKGSDADYTFVWGRNDGSGTFSILTNIMDGDGDFLQGVAAVKLQQAGPPAIALSWHKQGKGIQTLTIPPTPSDDRWNLDKISSDSQDECLSAGDIDRDGDEDLLLGTKWLQNNGASWEVIPIVENDQAPDRNRLADINADGRLDAVVGYEATSKKGKLAWYEQGPNAMYGWREHVIANIIGPMSVDIADMDQDGDIDVVAGEHNLKKPDSAKLYIFENIDTKGLRWRTHIVATGDEHHDGARVTDIDGDGDMDIVSIGWSHGRVLLYNNLAGE